MINDIYVCALWNLYSTAVVGLMANFCYCRSHKSELLMLYLDVHPVT